MCDRKGIFDFECDGDAKTKCEMNQNGLGLERFQGICNPLFSSHLEPGLFTFSFLVFLGHFFS